MQSLILVLSTASNIVAYLAGILFGYEAEWMGMCVMLCMITQVLGVMPVIMRRAGGLVHWRTRILVWSLALVSFAAYCLLEGTREDRVETSHGVILSIAYSVAFLDTMDCPTPNKATFLVVCDVLSKSKQEQGVCGVLTDSIVQKITGQWGALCHPSLPDSTRHWCPCASWLTLSWCERLFLFFLFFLAGMSLLEIGPYVIHAEHRRHP